MKIQFILMVALLATSVSLQAGIYSVNFDSYASGTTNLGDGSSILDDYSPTESHTAAEVYEHSGTSFSWTALRLVEDQAPVSLNYAAYILPDLDPGTAIDSFDLSFDLLMKSAGSPATVFLSVSVIWTPQPMASLRMFSLQAEAMS